MIKKALTLPIPLKCVFIIAAIVILLTQTGWISRPTVNYVSIHIHAGDTLWSIASATAEESDDIRYIVWEIMKKNNLPEGQQIHPGQILQVPYTAASLHRLQDGFDVW